MTDKQFAEKIQNSKFLKYPLRNKKALGLIKNSNNNLIVSESKEKRKGDFDEKFKNTGYISKNNCTYSVSFKNKNKTEKLLCNFVAWIEEEVTVDDGLETRKIKLAENMETTMTYQK
jgi:hypothetical protein